MRSTPFTLGGYTETTTSPRRVISSLIIARRPVAPLDVHLDNNCVAGADQLTEFRGRHGAEWSLTTYHGQAVFPSPPAQQSSARADDTIRTGAARRMPRNRRLSVRTGLPAKRARLIVAVLRRDASNDCARAAKLPVIRKGADVLKAFSVICMAIVIGAGPAVAQAIDSTTGPVRELVEYLDENGKVALIRGARITRLVTRARMVGDCRVVFTQATDLGGTASVIETEAPLGALSTTVTVKPWGDKRAFAVKAVTSNGEDELSKRTTAGIGPNGKTYFLDMALSDSAVADAAAQHLATAIRRCGGKPLSAEARARDKANVTKQKAATDSLLGGGFSAEERALIVKTCRDVIRAKLRAPSQATFDGGAAEPSVFAVTDGNPMLVGKVEGQNAMGGRVEQSYMCSMEKFGKHYVPKTATILN